MKQLEWACLCKLYSLVLRPDRKTGKKGGHGKEEDPLTPEFSGSLWQLRVKSLRDRTVKVARNWKHSLCIVKDLKSLGQPLRPMLLSGRNLPQGAPGTTSQPHSSEKREKRKVSFLAILWSVIWESALVKILKHDLCGCVWFSPSKPLFLLTLILKSIQKSFF